MAKIIAHHIVSEKLLDYIELSKECGIVEIMATEKIHGRTLIDLHVRAKYGCNNVAIKQGEDIIVSPMADERMRQGDIMIVIEKNEDITRFEEEGL